MVIATRYVFNSLNGKIHRADDAQARGHFGLRKLDRIVARMLVEQLLMPQQRIDLDHGGTQIQRRRFHIAKLRFKLVKPLGRRERQLRLSVAGVERDGDL